LLAGAGARPDHLISDAGHLYAADPPDSDLIYGTAAMTMIGIATLVLLLLLLLVSSGRRGARCKIVN
jgi:hypothetical protein